MASAAGQAGWEFTPSVSTSEVSKIWGNILSLFCASACSSGFRTVNTWSEGWNTFPISKGWESWVCSAWRREGSGGDLTAGFQYLKGACKKAGEGILQDRTRGKGFKLVEGRLIFDTRKKFLAHWHRLPREAVAAPSLAVLKVRLDGALSNLV